MDSIINISSSTCLNCLICLGSDTTITSPVISITALPHIIKKCHCQYDIHSVCMEKWLQTKDVCPFCMKKIIFESNNLFIEMPPPPSDNNTVVVIVPPVSGINYAMNLYCFNLKGRVITFLFFCLILFCLFVC